MCYTNTTALSRDLQIVHATASITLAIVGTIGNTLSIALICRGQLYRSSPIMTLIINLCVANLISTAWTLPIIATHSFADHWLLGQDFCRVFGYILYVGLTTECIILLDITIFQYLLIVHRFSGCLILRHNPKVYHFLLLGMPWVVVMLLFLIPLTEAWDKFGYDQRRGYCTIITLEQGMGFQAALAIIIIMTMTVTIFYCYPAIFYVHLKSKRKTTTSVQEATARYRGRARNTQLIKMMTVILSNYMVTYLPFLINSAVDPCIISTPLPVYTAVIYVSWSHAAINPVIYALTNARINAMWRGLILCRKTAAASTEFVDELIVKAASEDVNPPYAIACSPQAQTHEPIEGNACES